MDLDFSEEQQLLRDTVRRICEASFDAPMVRRLEDEADKFNRDFWAALGDSGLCALGIAESRGGAGMGALDMAIVFEEFGRTLASSPFLQSCIESARILSSGDPGTLQGQWLARIASGDAIVVPALADASAGDGAGGIMFDGATKAVSGTAVLVPFASVADAFLVRCSDVGGSGWALVPARADGISIVAQPNYASQALFALSFDKTLAENEALFAETPDAEYESCCDALIAAAAEAVGSADRLLEITTAYANQRSQFGRPIAGFQAISHPLADCATELEGARYLVYQAAWAKDQGMDALHLARMAKVQAATLYRRLATVSVQIHGGIGYSTEGEPQLFYRRSKYHELMNGTPHALKKSIADRIFA